MVTINLPLLTNVKKNHKTVMKTETKKINALLISMYGAAVSGIVITVFGLYQVSLLY